MKVNSIKVKNIGPFSGEHQIDLSTSGQKNIILIGGKNGSGKTTILKSIKYGLFGSYALGYKNETKSYLDEIYSMLSIKSIGNDYSIEVNFCYQEQYKEIYVSIHRYWIKSERNLIEHCDVYVNGVKLDSKETIHFVDKIRTSISPELINSFIYDGEKISSTIDTNTISQYIKNMFEVVFNINVLNQMNLDLQAYLTNKVKKSASLNQISLVNSMKKVNSYKKELEKISKIESSLREKMDEVIVAEKSLNKQFFNRGGMTKEDQQNIELEMLMKSKQIESINKEYRNFIETDLPIYINLKLLKEAISNIKREVPANHYFKLKNAVEYFGLDNLDILDLSKKYDGYRFVHKLNEDEYEYITTRYKLLTQKKYDPMKLRNSSQKNTIELLANRVNKKNHDNIDIDFYTDELSKIGHKKKNINDEIEHTKIKKNEMQKVFDASYEEYQEMLNKVSKSYAYENSFNLSVQAININEKFIDYLIDSKTKEIASIALDVFNKSIRKNEMISKISIEKNFDITLYQNDEILPIRILSAGEKQILLSSLIYALVKCSNRDMFFVFDTPLARLDQENRSKFIDVIMKNISNQILILSTDSEFTGAHYKSINNNIKEQYILDYNNSNYYTNIRKGYFEGV